MRVPDTVLKCVGFVAEATALDATSEVIDHWGTGFIVSIPSSTKGKSFFMFVTAKHLILPLLDRPVHFIVNKVDGGVVRLPSAGNIWYGHPTDKTADVLVIPILPTSDLDISSIPIADLVTPELMIKKNYGVGDDVFITGLFTLAPGVSRNTPIVRHGNIVMLPDEQIQTEAGFADVYLIEARSIGGLSGSPVMVRPTLSISGQCGDGRDTALHGVGDFDLLGLMQGHWDIKESEINKASVSHDHKHGVNMGIAIVVPAIKILETINRGDLVEMRRQIVERAERERGSESFSRMMKKSV